MYPLRFFLLALFCFCSACSNESGQASTDSSDSLNQEKPAAPQRLISSPADEHTLSLDLAQYQGKPVRDLLFDPQFDAFLQERLGGAYGDIVGNMGTGEATILRKGDYLVLGGRILQQEQPHESILVVGLEGQQLYAATAKVEGPILRYFGGEQMPTLFVEWLQAHDKKVE